MDTYTQYATIPLSGTISTIFELRGSDNAALWVPVVTSCVGYMQASIDTTSANFFRVQNAAGSADYDRSIAAGSKCYRVGEAARLMRYCRLEVSVPQTSVRTLAMTTKF